MLRTTIILIVFLAHAPLSAQAAIILSLGELAPGTPAAPDDDIPVTIEIYAYSDSADAVNGMVARVQGSASVFSVDPDRSTNPLGFGGSGLGAVTFNFLHGSTTTFEANFSDFLSKISIPSTPTRLTTVTLLVDPSFVGNFTLTLIQGESDGGIDVSTGDPTSRTIRIPEPASLALLALGSLVMLGSRLRGSRG